ncbi:isoprenylcysteine carboxyl methyltransferase family protein [Peribacillus simplex]|uniref:Isoprenylcysteine carboxyl methyltransferase n=2 Tax=Peribacillus simplex TaxID=1478 RepID=A0A223EMF5_9BACI|nr:isoprenylcysteine carboxylmethyltransferase family protein [Peribacillus simplex]ASS96457.1 isoprenylcysteine carboxyl methyltransferase [Peribacillus simplex NBRC 15720 = DSM 1321]MEC1397594.1 isoprenylcysteine carboxylmethyltransferase family protein [Peribacillus simplex]MED3911000.1 isoprenylcysteine carboxylmethyltransferase family protein [Peribacillus simplex]TVX81293.1 isoprenylcysteine carboxyl methyltransferase [Peribacillus simplex]
MIFAIFIILIAIQRLVELNIAKQNEKQLKVAGAVEYGESHYRWMVLMHLSFFIVLIIEVVVLERDVAGLWPIWLTLFIIAQTGRIWVIRSLGKHWNTKIIVVPDADVVIKGPYKYFKHPNYIIVATEIIVISLLFNAYYTAIIFSLLNVWMMTVRIPLEEKALKEHTEYSAVFKGK